MNISYLLYVQKYYLFHKLYKCRYVKDIVGRFFSFSEEHFNGPNYMLHEPHNSNKQNYNLLHNLKRRIVLFKNTTLRHLDVSRGKDKFRNHKYLVFAQKYCRKTI